MLKEKNHTILNRIMYSFNANKIWYSADKKSYMILCKSDIDILSEKVNSLHGGMFKKGQTISLSSPFKSIYDVVVIKNHPCVLIKELGSGSYGKVYEAYDLRVNKKVAVKCQPGYLASVIDKQAAITKMNGIGLTDLSVNIGPSYLRDGNGYFILPLADSCFHNWVIQKVVAGQEKLIVKALIKIAQDLQVLHSQRKVHMDLKTDNVLVIQDEAFLSDFGKVEILGTSVTCAREDPSRYPQCAPEYFCLVSGKPLYTVNTSYDLYSFGYLMKSVSKMMKNRKYKTEVASIASYLHKMNPADRKPLSEIIIYLNKTLAK